MKVTLFTTYKDLMQHSVHYVHFTAFLYHLEYLQSDGVCVVGGIWE